MSTRVAKQLAKRFDGDLSSADWRHFGRLAGFTNTKRERRLPTGMGPFVRLLSATGHVYSKAAEFIAGIGTSSDGAAGQGEEPRKHRAGAGGNARESGHWRSFTPIHIPCRSSSG
jgi:hypothetical protein